MKYLTTLLLLSLVSTVGAGPLTRKDVSAQAAWVLHLDFDGLRPTQLGQYFFSELEKPQAQDKFAAFQVMFNFDPRRQVRGATLYSTSRRPEDGVLLVYGEFDAARLVTLVKAAHEYEAQVRGTHTIHSWTDKKKPGQRAFAAIHGSRIIFGQQFASVGAALDVLDGSASLLTSGAFPQLSGAPGPFFIQAASQKIDAGDSNPAAAVLRQSQGLHFQLGEAQQKVTAALALQASTEETAGHIASILRGLVALMKLQTDKPGAAKLAEATSLDQNGATVVCGWALPAGDVIDFLRSEAARKAAGQ